MSSLARVRERVAAQRPGEGAAAIACERPHPHPSLRATFSRRREKGHAPAGGRRDTEGRIKVLPAHGTPTVSSAPFAQKQPKIGAVDHAVAVEVRGASGDQAQRARTPLRQQDAQVGSINVAVAVQVGVHRRGEIRTQDSGLRT